MAQEINGDFMSDKYWEPDIEPGDADTPIDWAYYEQNSQYVWSDNPSGSADISKPISGDSAIFNGQEYFNHNCIVTGTEACDSLTFTDAAVDLNDNQLEISGSLTVTTVLTYGGQSTGTIGNGASVIIDSSGNLQVNGTYTNNHVTTGMQSSSGFDLSGSMTVVGAFINNDDASQCTIQASGVLTLQTGPSVSGRAGAALSYQYNYPALTFQSTPGYSATGLPSGLSINSSGLITGTPTVSGVFSPIITTGNGTTGILHQTMTMIIIAAPTRILIWS